MQLVEKDSKPVVLTVFRITKELEKILSVSSRGQRVEIKVKFLEILTVICKIKNTN